MKEGACAKLADRLFVSVIASGREEGGVPRERCTPFNPLYSANHPPGNSLTHFSLSFFLFSFFPVFSVLAPRRLYRAKGHRQIYFLVKVLQNRKLWSTKVHYPVLWSRLKGFSLFGPHPPIAFYPHGQREPSHSPMRWKTCVDERKGVLLDTEGHKMRKGQLSAGTRLA